MSQGNLRRRYLKAEVEEADASWAGFHAFRHTFASMKIDDGANIVQLSRVLGHHSASFTLDVYGHLLDDDTGDPLDLDIALKRINAHPIEAAKAQVERSNLALS